MYYFIVNPSSGSGRGKKIWYEIRRKMKEKGLPYKVSFTREPGSGGRLCRKIQKTAIPARDRLLVVGGDGTFNEVINGRDPGNTLPMAYLPVGSGNDLARGLDLSGEPMDILERMISGMAPETMDLGNVSIPQQHVSTDISDPSPVQARFAISSGMGYDAAICAMSNSSKIKKVLNKIHLGSLIYAVSAVRSLASFKTFEMDITIDGDTKHYNKVYFATAMNLPYEGGGFKLCPKAKRDDGILDLIIVEGLPKPILLLFFPIAYFAAHTILPGIHQLSGREISIKASGPQQIHTDGETPWQSDEITFKVLPRELRIYR